MRVTSLAADASQYAADAQTPLIAAMTGLVPLDTPDFHRRLGDAENLPAGHSSRTGIGLASPTPTTTELAVRCRPLTDTN